MHPLSALRYIDKGILQGDTPHKQQKIGNRIGLPKRTPYALISTELHAQTLPKSLPFLCLFFAFSLPKLLKKVKGPHRVVKPLRYWVCRLLELLRSDYASHFANLV